MTYFVVITFKRVKLLKCAMTYLNQPNECAPSEGSDQSENWLNLITVSTGRLVGNYIGMDPKLSFRPPLIML